MAEEYATTTQTETEAAETNSGTLNKGGPDYDAIFAKLDAILDKRADGLARSALKDNGISEEEAREIAAAYRAHKAGAEKSAAESLTALRTENADLKAQIMQSRIQTEVRRAAASQGVGAEMVPYLMRLGDFAGAVNAKGELSAEKISEAVQKVLTDLPALKADKRGGGVVAIGGNGSQDPAQAESDKMRRWFGLSPQK